jgi:serine/threonine-protein kinase
MGTPQYLSPEQARGGTATPASDVYSLGVVAFECLAGHRPFDADSPVATALAHLNDPVPALPRSVPADLAAVVQRAMSKEPAQRFADGDAFAAALRDPSAAAETAYVPVPATDVASERTQTLPGAPPPPAPAPTPAAEEPPPDRRSAWPVVLLALALVAVVVLIVVLVVWANEGEDAPSADGPSSTPPSSAPTTQDSTPSEPTSSAPAEVTIDENDYLGRDVDAVAAELRDKGLEVDTQPIDNPGDEEPDTVANISPTSGLHEGDTVTVEYYREAEPTSPPPSTDTGSPSPSDTTSPSSTASGTGASESGSPTASASTKPSAAASTSASASTRGTR